MTDVKMRHIWQACCNLWPTMATTDKSDRSKDAVAQRNAFAAIAQHFGHSYSQISKFIGKERSTIVYSVRQAEAKRQRDAIYALSIHHICKEARRIADGEPASASIPGFKVDHAAQQELQGRTTMMEGSENLLRAIVREHPHYFACTNVVHRKLSPRACGSVTYLNAHKIPHGNIAA